MDIFRLSGMKYPIHILAPTFSTVSLGIAPQNFCLPYPVGQAHRNTVLSFYVGRNCPKIKGKSIYVDYFSQFNRMDVTRAR